MVQTLLEDIQLLKKLKSQMLDLSTWNQYYVESHRRALYRYDEEGLMEQYYELEVDTSIIDVVSTLSAADIFS